MKILRVTSIGCESGGVENGIMLAQKVLERKGHTVRTLASDARGSGAHFAHYTFPAISSQPLLLRIFYRAWYPHAFFALRKVLKEYKPDVVHIHTMFEVSPSVLFLLRAYPTVLTVHGAEDFTPSLLLWSFPLRFFKNRIRDRAHLRLIGTLHHLYHKWLSAPLYRLGMRNVNCVVVLSMYMRKVLARDGVDATYIPNGTALFTTHPLPDTPDTIMYSGRLEEYKGVQYLMHAHASLLRSYPDLTLVVAGDGPYASTLNMLAHTLGTEKKVVFTGHISRAQLEQYYRASSVVVVPSVWPEPFGKVGIEAMSVGRPVVASAVGGVREWLEDNVTGISVPPKDIRALVQALTRILSDGTLRAHMARAARKRAETYDITRHVDAILTCYERARAVRS